VGRANLPSRFLEELPSEMMDIEELKPEEDRSWSEEPFADFVQHETNEPSRASDVIRNYREQELPSPPSEEWSLSPEGFYPLKIGMKVKHSKFGVGRVRSVEGTNEDQKATIIFQTVGVKRLKVAYAQLEILE
jgi:DNA helicase-2/ATP-dependent DNA helicase PcrA